MNKKPGRRRTAQAFTAREGDFVKVESDMFDALVVHTARVFKAGNSLAILIPNAIAEDCELEDGASIEMATDHGVICVRKAPSRDLAALIDRITPRNVHTSEFDGC